MEYRLSKSKYLAGLQCHKNLWLKINAPEKAAPPSTFREHIFRQGSNVGLLAQKEFPGGIQLKTPSYEADTAIAVIII